MIEQVKCEGKEYPFLFAWSTYKEHVEAVKGISEDAEVSSLFNFYDKGVHLGFVCGAKKSGEKPFSFEKMLDMFDEFPEFQESALDVFFKHFGAQKKIQDKIMKSTQVLNK